MQQQDVSPDLNNISLTELKQAFLQQKLLIQQLNQTLEKLTNEQQQEIQQVRDYYENIIAMMPGHVYWLDRNNVFLGCNNLQAQHANLKDRSEIVGKTNQDLPWKEQADELNKVNERVMQTGETYFVEEFAEMTNGSKVYLTHKVPMKNQVGEVIGVLGISFDITERKKAEELLNEKIKLEEQQKITELYAERMQLLGAAIAHELKTPLISIQFLSDSINQYFQNHLSASQKAFEEKTLQTMSEAISSIYKEAKTTLHMMEMLLCNLYYQAQGIEASEFKIYSMLDVVTEALKRYPFINVSQENTVFLRAKKDDDFQFYGSNILMMQVIFNLLKNALHFIRIEQKGIITIQFTSDEQSHKLHFRDTARGMSEEIKAKLFENHFSTKKFGTGIGLAFCKLVIESMKGSITCEAKEGKYAEFILRFPK